MPRVWITVEDDGLRLDTEENPDGMPVEMNASLYRQVQHSIRQYTKFQNVLAKFYTEATEHPDYVRRVR